MTEKIIVSPQRVRCLGDVVSPKAVSDFDKVSCTLSSSSDTVYGTVYSESYLAGSTLSLVYDGLIGSETESFTVSATLNDSIGSAISSVSVYLSLNGVVTSATTNSSGVATFNVSTVEEATEYLFKVYYTGTDSVCGSYAYGCVRVGDVTGLTLNGSPSVIQSGDKSNIWAKLTGTGNLQGALVKFYEVWTPSIRLSGDKSVIQSGDSVDLSAQLCDSDGSLVREAGHNITFGVEQDTITMFNGTETFTRANDRTGTLNIEYTSSNELKYTSSEGVYFHSDLMFQSDNNWECEFKFKATGTNGGRIGLYAVSSTDGEYECIAIQFRSTSTIKIDTQTGDESRVTTDVNHSQGTYGTLKIVVSDGSASIYCDSIFVKTVTLDWWNEPLCFGLHGWTTGNVIYVKDFSFKESE